MRASELAKRTRTTTRALRYYESLGLLSPRRLENGYREYQECDVLRVHNIRLLFSVGLNGSKVAAFIDFVHSDFSKNIFVEPEMLAAVSETRAAIAEQIAQLNGTLAKLDALVALVDNHNQAKAA